MKQEQFEAEHRAFWDQFAERLAELDKGPRWRKAKADTEQRRLGAEFPAQYRQICHHLALARARRYSINLQDHLNQLALDGHQYLYRSRLPLLANIARFFMRDFPQAFRRCWRAMLVSGLVFYLPAFAMAWVVQVKPEVIYSLVDPLQVAQMESMYDPANDALGRERQSDTDTLMFGYYIYNNITVGFQTFAGGLVFGIGSLFYLMFNGLYFGAIASHLTSAGFTETFWGFVAGHSALELTAIMIFGGIGLLIGFAAVAPGQRSRWHAVRTRARESLPLIYGATAMLVGAAFVEAYWSSTSWPPLTTKVAVGLLFWALVIAYFTFMGRDEPR